MHEVFHKFSRGDWRVFDWQNRDQDIIDKIDIKISTKNPGTVERYLLASFSLDVKLNL